MPVYFEIAEKVLASFFSRATPLPPTDLGTAEKPGFSAEGQARCSMKGDYVGIKRITMIVLLGLWVMSVIGCSQEAGLPTAPAGYETYSEYGFSFQYPGECTVAEIGLLLNLPNEYSGAVEVGMKNEGGKLFEVVWMKKSPHSLEGALETGFAIMETKEGIASVDRGELVEADKAGHRMLCQYYTATSAEGDKSYGIAAVLYCDRTQNLYSLVTMNNDISARHDVLQDFRNYLDSFVCH